MIKFSLKCSQGHAFDSWFKSADAYDSLAARGLVSCALCGDGNVSKSMMAPSVNSREPSVKGVESGRALAAPGSHAEAAIGALRRRIEAESDYVGKNFAAEARRMHEGETPSRSIHGEAHREEARKLLEDGVPIMPLPFGPARKVN